MNKCCYLCGRHQAEYDDSLRVLGVVAFTGDVRRITGSDVLEIGLPVQRSMMREMGKPVDAIKGNGEVR
jgi:hypothetical protein